MEWLSNNWKEIAAVTASIAAIVVFVKDALDLKTSFKNAFPETSRQSIIYMPNEEEIEKYGKKHDVRSPFVFPIVLIAIVGLTLAFVQQSRVNDRLRLAHSALKDKNARIMVKRENVDIYLRGLQAGDSESVSSNGIANSLISDIKPQSVGEYAELIENLEAELKVLRMNNVVLLKRQAELHAIIDELKLAKESIVEE